MRNAGAVFLGPYAPTALGDYAAGANHVLPTGRSARFASALRVDDFRKHVHVVRRRRGRARASASAHRLAGPKDSTAHARSLDLRSSPVNDRPRLPAPRDDLRALEGYHSPQLDVSVRLNTNESPFPPPPEFVDAWLAALARPRCTAIPIGRRASSARAMADALGQPPVRVFCANGSNEVLQTLLLTYGGPAGRRSCSSRRTRCTATSPGPDRHRGRRRCRAATTSPFADRSRAAHRSPSGPRSSSSAARTTRPAPSSRARPSRPSSTGRRPASSSSTRRTASSPASAVELVDDDVPLVVTRTYSKVWSLAALRLGFCVAPPGVVTSSRRWCSPYHLDVAPSWPASTALAFDAEMQGPGRRLVEERHRLFAALARLPGLTVFPSGANFLLFRGRQRRATRSGSALSTAGCSCATSPLPRLEDCLRVTVGTPAEDDQLLSALRESCEQAE